MSTATAPIKAQPTASAPKSSAPLMSHRQILLVIYALMAGMFLSSLDQTIVGTAIRTIGDDLHGLNDQAWVTTAYLITSTIAVPIYGKLSDIFGRRPLYIFGIVVFNDLDNACWWLGVRQSDVETLLGDLRAQIRHDQNVAS